MDEKKNNTKISDFFPCRKNLPRMNEDKDKKNGSFSYQEDHHLHVPILIFTPPCQDSGGSVDHSGDDESFDCLDLHSQQPCTLISPEDDIIDSGSDLLTHKPLFYAASWVETANSNVFIHYRGMHEIRPDLGRHTALVPAESSILRGEQILVNGHSENFTGLVRYVQGTGLVPVDDIDRDGGSTTTDFI